MHRPLVLAFDTSAAHCAAALLSQDTVLAERQIGMAKGQAERLMPMLNDLLAEAGLEWRDLDAIAVGVGPGNFTGIRISVAAARGLSLALGVPAIGVSLFEALAIGNRGPALAVLPAPRDAFYVQPVRDDRTEGAPSYTQTPSRDTGRHLTILPQPIAPVLARIGAARLQAGSAGPRPAPLYIRPVDAAPAAPAPRILG